MVYSIRTANRALVVEGGRLLVTVHHDPDDGLDYYMLPDGGQDFGEDRITALLRECREEIGCDVVVDGLAVPRSYIGRNHRLAAFDRDFHQEEAIWWYTVAPGQVPTLGPVGDVRQTGVAWMTPDELRASGEFVPMPILDWLDLPVAERPPYVGDVL